MLHDILQEKGINDGDVISLSFIDSNDKEITVGNIIVSYDKKTETVIDYYNDTQDSSIVFAGTMSLLTSQYNTDKLYFVYNEFIKDYCNNVININGWNYTSSIITIFKSQDLINQSQVPGLKSMQINVIGHIDELEKIDNFYWD